MIYLYYGITKLLKSIFYFGEVSYPLTSPFKNVTGGGTMSDDLRTFIIDVFNILIICIIYLLIKLCNPQVKGLSVPYFNDFKKRT